VWRKPFSNKEALKLLRWAPYNQGSGGVTIPGGVQKTHRHGALGCGLVGMVVLG